MTLSLSINTLVNAVITANAENLTDEIWSPAKLLSLGIDYNGVNLRFVRAETLAGMLLRHRTTTDLETERIGMEELSNSAFQGGHGPCGRRPVIVEAGGLGVRG
jgi:hypothetical protein